MKKWSGDCAVETRTRELQVLGGEKESYCRAEEEWKDEAEEQRLWWWDKGVPSEKRRRGHRQQMTSK